MNIMDILDQSIFTLPRYLSDANKRIFSVYLISALLLAVPAYYLHAGKFSFGDFGRYLFNRKIWLHESAKLDYALFIVNRFTKALLWAPIVMTMVPIAIGFSDLLDTIFGKLEPVTQNEALIIGSFTVLLFVLDDLTRFLLHLALHKIPFLWDIHKVHHSARVLTPMTIYRSHPLESYFYACRMALAQGLAVGIGYYFFGPTLSMFDVLGANLFVFVFNLMGSNLRHSHVKWSWGDTLENWFISPLQHQIHHSDNPKHFDRNLGSALAIWDKCCGTLIKASEVGRIRFGLGRHQRGHRTLLQSYVGPFQDMYGRITNPTKTKSDDSLTPVVEALESEPTQKVVE